MGAELLGICWVWAMATEVKRKPEIELIIDYVGGGNGRNRPPADRRGGGDDFRNNKRPEKSSPQRYVTGITVALVSVLVFFLALVVTYVALKHSNPEWQRFKFPALVWLNTVMLLGSSATLEAARWRLKRSDVTGFRGLWALTTLLGCGFLFGQVAVWRMLADQGVYLSTNPASSFFFIFTIAHALHVVGGLGGLLFVQFRNFDRADVSRTTAAAVTSYFWHFLDGLWVFLALLFYVGR
jgi:cytochrome c oxidase subunit III